MKILVSRSQGFSLVELMVALLIGLVIILGAGQLFLVGFQNFRKIEELSDKQAALTFAADVLVRDIRRSDPSDLVHGENFITVSQGTYKAECPDPLPQEGCSLRLDEDGSNPQPVAAGLDPSYPFKVEEVGSGSKLYKLTIRLVRENGYEEVVFHVQNRSSKF